MTTPPTGPIDPDSAIQPTSINERGGAKPQNFQEHMQRELPSNEANAAHAPTPMDIANEPKIPPMTPDIATVLNQAKTAQDTLGTVENQLNSPNLKLKRSQSHLLKNKLMQAHEHINEAAAKLGIQPKTAKLPSGANPMGRFLAYVNDGQDQLIQVKNSLAQMAAHGGQLNAADMLAVTVKMNLAQQEIEYSSTLLGKVLESFKQIMNTQL